MEESKLWKYLMVLIGAFNLTVLLYAIAWHYLDHTSTSASQPSLTNSTLTLPIPMAQGPRVEPTLQFVVIFSRHGKRGPYGDFPAVPYPAQNKTIYPHGRLQLTQPGRRQAYKLGMKIRSLYNGFLSPTYSPEQIRAYSTNTDRTHMTALLFLAALFPPKDHLVWNNDIYWHPIPVFTTYLDHWEVCVNASQCPRFYGSQNKSVERFRNKFKSDIDFLMKHIGNISEEYNEDFSSMKFVLYYLWEQLHAAVSQHLPIPEFAKNIYPEPLKSLMAEFFYASTVGTDDMIKLTEGQLFKELISLIEAKIDGTLKPNRRMFYYSTHDFTLLSLKAILEDGGVSRRSLVETGSALIFELHKHPSSDEYFVKILYIDGGSKHMEPSVINIPACGYPCDFRTLKNYTNKYIISDWDEECQVIVNNL